MSQNAHPDRITCQEGENFNSQSDEELMRYYQEGREEAFSVLFERHSRRVLGFLSKKLGNVQSAQDLTQEVFLKLHRSRMQYTATLPFVPWLFSITRSVWIDGLKKKKNEKLIGHALLEKLSPTTEPVLPFNNPEILDHLLPNQKTAISMKVYDDATFEEIALRLATSPENARQLVSRGLRNLKGMMEFKKD